MTLDLQKYLTHLRIENRHNRRKIFDPVRKKWLVLTAEEIVRQAALYYLIEIKDYPKSLIGVEKKLVYNTLSKRYDIVVYNKNHQPLILVECKSAQTPLGKTTIEQATVYNEELGVKIIWITNGHNNFIFEIDNQERKVSLLGDLPLAGKIYTSL